MFDIEIYEDSHGRSELKEYLKSLKAKSATDKDSRIKLTKIVAYINILEEMGTRAGMPAMRHLQGEIWELRPISNRILFAALYEDKFLLLHSFQKTTNKTPSREIQKAIRELKDYKERMNRK